VLAGLWSGEPFQYEGTHYHIAETIFMPTPRQAPRIPVWVAGTWPRKAPFRRAARWDGVIPVRFDGPMSPDDVRDVLTYVAQQRMTDTPFDLIMPGMTPDDAGAAADVVQTLADAGATWWVELTGPFRGSLAETRARIRQGPPRAA
jgi:alkanesulfonate monooxygenase SsuD/methylene tetrahydromethanopterin reductase-like flavin-dependent oxidoreductase (luciferase family)